MQDQPVPAGDALSEVGRTSDLEVAEDMFWPTPLGAEGQHSPSPGRLSQFSPLRADADMQPDDGTHRENTPRHDLASEGHSDNGGEVELPRLRSESWQSAAIRQGIRQSTPLENQHVQSPGWFPKLSLWPDDSMDRGSTPHHGSADGGARRGRISRPDSASEGDGADDIEPPRAKSSRKRAAVRRGLRRSCVRQSRDTVGVDSDDGDEAKAVQADRQDSPRYHLRRRRHGSTEASDEDLYHPRDSEQDEEDDTYHRLPLRKRRRANPSTPSTLVKIAAGQQTHSDSGGSQLRQARTPVSGRKYSGRYSIPIPPSSLRSDEGLARVPTAKFEEWPLKGAVLKRVTENGLVTFQLQFTWDPHLEHKRGGRPRREPSVKRRPSVPQNSTPRRHFVPEEDRYLIELKGQGLSWKEIRRQYNSAFPERERG